MKTMHKNIAALALSALAVSSAAGQSYTLIDLGAFAGQSEAYGLAPGSVALGSFVNTDSHFQSVLFTTPETVLSSVGGYREQVAFASDGMGRVYGTSYTFGDLTPSGFVADSLGVSLLAPFAARASNGSGVIAGTSYAADSGLRYLPRAAVWNNGTLSVLGTLGGASAQALAIDDRGWVVGSSTTANEASSRPALWKSATAADLGTLGGTAGQATAIRGARVVGHSQNAAGVRRATLWTIDAAGNVVSRSDLGGLSATAYSYALGVNSAGKAVGTSRFHAVLFDGASCVDLNTRIPPSAGWTLEKAWAINDAGVIVGGGNYLGFPRAFMLVPDCPADFNHDGFVNGNDYDEFASL
ncbi:MAG: hypothetical protein JNL50_08475, partial [Phycisphaerae bacterium]|nr:hypothetical protein [Phycisphaerae bacterium]